LCVGEMAVFQKRCLSRPGYMNGKIIGSIPIHATKTKTIEYE